MCACGVQRGAPRCHAHEVGGAGEGVQVAGGIREQGRIGEEERIAAAGQGGIAHFVVVKGQQGHGIARQRRLIALGAQHGQLPGGHVQQGSAALAAVGRQEELHRHAPGSRVKGGDIQYPQVAGQGHALRLPAVHLLAEKHTVPQEVICAAVKGEIAVHVLGRRPCARLRQTAAEKLPDDVFPVAQGEAVGQGLLLQIPHAVQHRLLPHGVGIGVHQLHGGAVLLVVRPCDQQAGAAGGIQGAQRRGRGAGKRCDRRAVLGCPQAAAGQKQN